MAKSIQAAGYDFSKTSSVNGYTVGWNGLSGLNQWECYMLLKFGKSNNFSANDKSQYLIELPMYPEEVSESISAQWSTQNVLGRSSPLSAYSNTSLKSVSFSLDLHRDFLTGSFSHTENTMRSAAGEYYDPSKQLAGEQPQSDAGPFRTRSWYINANKMLQMSCYPQYTQQGLIPPTTYFIFGQMILKGYVTSYQTVWKKPIINSFYAWNSVSISMECYPDSIISAHDLIEGTGAMSTQNTYNTLFPSNSASSSNVMSRDFKRTNNRTESSLGGGSRYT